MGLAGGLASNGGVNAGELPPSAVLASSVPRNVRSVVFADSPVTAAAGDFILANATGGSITVNLPASASGTQIVVKKTDASANTVSVVGTIDGGANASLAYQNQGLALEGDGSGYQRVVRQSLATGIVDYPATPDARYVHQDGTGMPATVVSDSSQVDLCAAPYNAVAGTDITTSLQTVLNTLAAATSDLTIKFSKSGVYYIDGALQIGVSSTTPATQYCGQLLFPARAASAGAISVRFKGLTPPAITPAVGGVEPIHTGGVILQSRLSTPAVQATLSSGLSTSAAITALPVNALSLPGGMTKLPSGDNVYTVSGANFQVWTLTADAAAGATSLTVQSDTPNFAYPGSSNVNYAGWMFDAIAATKFSAIPTAVTDIRVTFENITLRGQADPVVGAVNGYSLGALRFHGAVSIDAVLTGGNPPSSYTGGGIGVRFPTFDRYCVNRQEGIMQVIGYPVGVAYPEHTHLDDIYCGYCFIGLQPEGGPGHGALIDRALIQGTTHAIRPVGSAGNPMWTKIGLLDVGDTAGSSVALDTVVNDPTNIFFGQLTVCQTSPDGATSRGFKVRGAQFVKFIPYIGNQSGRWVENWPSDAFTRLGTTSNNRTYIGVSDNTHHVWIPSTNLQTSFVTGGGILKSAASAEAYVVYCPGRAGLSRIVRMVAATSSGSYDIYLCLNKAFSGANTANRLYVSLQSGKVTLGKFIGGSATALVTSNAAVVTTSTTYTVDAAIATSPAGVVTVTVYLNSTAILTTVTNGTGTLASGTYTLSAAEAAQISDTDQLRVQDGVAFFGDTASQVTFWAAMPN